MLETPPTAVSTLAQYGDATRSPELKSIKHEQNGWHYVDDILHDVEQR